MKKIIINLTIAVMFFTAIKVKAQLPLAFGDGVITHSNNQGWTTGGNQPLIRVIHTSNTLTAPLGSTWVSPPKPSNNYYSNWDIANLGLIFGITLDQNAQPNIYVSSTQIFAGTANNNRKIWRIDGNTGANKLVYDFNNPSGIGSATSTNSLGNVKYMKTATNENMYVSDWQTGEIHRLVGASAGIAIWANQPAFNPKFGNNTDNPNELPYGIAIRKTITGVKLYYSKIYKSPIAGYYGSNQIYSVALNPDGSFNTATEQLINNPSLSSISIKQPISDIAFTDDGKRMLLSQQSWYGTFGLVSVVHNTSVWEFTDNTFTDNFIPSIHSFEAGTFSTHQNSSGGVSYSNNVLKKDSLSFGCDTAVYFTSDAIYRVWPLDTYGAMGYTSSGGTNANAIWIDGDDNLTGDDKEKIGDIEIYKKPNVCTTGCSCGQWLTTPTLNGQPINGVPVIKYTPNQTETKTAKISAKGSGLGTSTAHLPYNYPIQFVKGNVTGLINASYQCNGSCPPTYSWILTNSSGGTIASGPTLPVDLATYNSKLDCGKYNLVIKAKCGNSDCDSYTIPITIICEPTNCCKNQIDISLESSTVNAVTNIPNPLAYSTGSFSFLMNFSAPMTEVRVNVEDFKLIANSPNCLNCNNRPVTWGNVLSASLNGTPMVLSGNLGVPTGTISTDYREAVYNTGNLLMPSSAGLSIQLSLPTITELSCCEVSAYVCLKFTFKDANCVECIQMVCGTFKLVPKANPHWPPYDKKELIKANDIQKYKVLH